MYDKYMIIVPYKYIQRIHEEVCTKNKYEK